MTLFIPEFFTNNPLASLMALCVLGVYAITCIFAYKFIQMAIYGRPLQGPASVGRGIAAITVLMGGLLFLFWSLDQLAVYTTGNNLGIYLPAAVLVLLFSLVLGGFIAVKTSEDTARMNLKMVAAIGFLPHFFISTLAFSKLPGWLNLLDFAIYVPAIIVGGFIYKRVARNMENSQQH